MSEPTITITVKEYERLLAESKYLRELESRDIPAWQGGYDSEED